MPRNLYNGCMNSINILKWTATAVTLAGAVATSMRIDPLNLYLLNAGSALFLFWGYSIRDRAMVVVNLGMLLIYLYGSMTLPGLDKAAILCDNGCIDRRL